MLPPKPTGKNACTVVKAVLCLGKDVRSYLNISNFAGRDQVFFVGRLSLKTQFINVESNEGGMRKRRKVKNEHEKKD